ncbi:MAG: TRAP transporter small permease subunit [Burkholderiaceae bacterium]
MRAGMAALSTAVDRFCRFGAAFGLVLMLVLIAIQVIARYVLSEPPGWTEEGARYAMVWSGLLGSAVAFKGGIDPVMLRLKSLEGNRPVAWLRGAAVVLFLAPILYFCVVGPGQDLARGFIARSASRSTEGMGLSMAWFTVSLPVAFIAILIHVAAELLARSKP